MFNLLFIFSFNLFKYILYKIKIINLKTNDSNMNIKNIAYTLVLSIFLYIKLEYMPVIPANGIYIKTFSTIFFLFITKYSIAEIMQSKITVLHPVRIIVDTSIKIATYKTEFTQIFFFLCIK